ncbi:uncharacterized protein LOC124301853 [Neodiprion virginianus]|uniref:uncharacterized protein LOC124301853 n=1 Tax=Neodiprion virginianus TaxID=2961670 RepID=UPI001EE742AB|nr:uncharacterized protein LOC124301853 [Neodiprion virginianus]
MLTTLSLVYFTVLLVGSSSEIIKCCPKGYSFGRTLKCVISVYSNSEFILNEANYGNQTDFNTTSCYRSGESVNDIQAADLEYARNLTEVDMCMDVDDRNGTVYVKSCPVDWRERPKRCDGVFTPIFPWGASIVIGAYLIHGIPFVIVVVLCILDPELRNRAYDKAVLSCCICQVCIAVVLSVMGYFFLCYELLRPTWLYIVFGLMLQFTTIGAVCWLNVICLEMTLAITRLRWRHGNDMTGSVEARKSFKYAAYVWGSSSVFTAITCFIELCPWIPTTSVLKPNFESVYDGVNYKVIFYVGLAPVITFILNNVLFIYTTYKVVNIRKSTVVASENNRKTKKKYFMYLRLYLVMDAPSIIGVISSIYPEIWVLKFIRMIQPISMLLAILPQKKFCRALRCSPAEKPAVVSQKRNIKGETSC